MWFIRVFLGLSIAALAVIWISQISDRPAVPPAKPLVNRTLPFVVLAYDDSGDFGPSTPGTKTSGWQEALKHCVQTKSDLYVKGGYGGRKAVYDIRETIRIPPAQDFRIDGGIYVINFQGVSNSDDAVVIDSAMNCEYKLGIIVYGGEGTALRIRPEQNVPLDSFATFTESSVQSQGVASTHPFSPDLKKSGTGILFDTSLAPIVYNQFSFSAVLNFQEQVRIEGNHGYESNQFVCDHLHSNVSGSRLAFLGKSARMSRFRVTVGVDQGAKDVQGLLTEGDGNTVEITARKRGFAADNVLTIQAAAKGNHIVLTSDDNPLTLVRDNSASSINTLAWRGTPPPVQIIDGTVGRFEYVQKLVPAIVALTSGKPDRVALQRGELTAEYTSVEGRELLLNPGDRLLIEGDAVPVIRVVPLY